MKKGYEFEGTVSRIDFPNRGIIEESGENVTVKNVLPGQRLRVRIAKKRGGRYTGRVLELLEKSPLESETPCPHFETCGGCLYQGIPYESELEIKADQIKRLLSPVVGADRFEDIFEGITGSPSSEDYRNKMELTFGDAVKGGELTLGMHSRGSFYDITATGDCRIMTADMRRVLNVTLSYFRGEEISHYHRVSHTGYLRHLLLRQAVNTGEILIDLVTSGSCTDRAGAGIDEKELLEGWKQAVLDADISGSIAGILHTLNDRVADTVADEGTEILFGRDFFEEKILNLRFKITPFSFFQTNSLGAEVLYDKAGEYITGACGENLGRVFDLYSGTGTIAQLVADAAAEVVGVEIVPEAVEAARINAKENHLTNTKFICGDVLKVLDELKEAPDVIVLDPPRDGIHPKALPKLLAYGVENILYISCKASSLARDLPFFFEAGYEAKRLCVIDMFPKTGGVETIALLGK